MGLVCSRVFVGAYVRSVLQFLTEIDFQMGCPCMRYEIRIVIEHVIVELAARKTIAANYWVSFSKFYMYFECETVKNRQNM